MERSRKIIERGWKELHMGADIAIPRIYKPIMKWITPLFLFLILIWWGATEAIPTLLMQTGQAPETVPYRWLSRGLMVLMLIVGVEMIRRAWRNRSDSPETID